MLESQQKLSRVIGRNAEQARFASLITELPRTVSGKAFLIEGEVGIGKSALVDTIRAHARRAGLRILDARGLGSDARTGFAGLHELLHPVLDQVEELPSRQWGALLTAFGLYAAPRRIGCC